MVLISSNFQFTKKEELLISFGRALAERFRTAYPDEIYTELKEEFTEEEIVVITAMGVLMVANNYFNDISKTRSIINVAFGSITICEQLVFYIIYYRREDF